MNKRMRELVDLLNRASYEYYTLDAPTMSDREWDGLYRELEDLEKSENTVLPDSPTRRVGGEVLTEFPPHTHIARLWSMNKAQSHEELSDWYDRCLRTLGAKKGGIRLAVEHKLDGLTVNLTYEGGLLVNAATRGDGITGEEILPQILTIPSVPMRVPYTGRFEIHGEVIMGISDFERYNASGAEPLKNPRNAAAGALRNLDPAVTKSRHLSVFFYDVGYIEGRSFADQEDMFAFMREMRFPVCGYLRYTSDMEEAVRLIDEIGETRADLDYMIDGAVLKVTDFLSREKLGFTDKFPRWAIAYKFEAEESVTTVRDITWEVGRTGKVTPLAHVDPVELAGATVRRATLNNMQDIRRKHVRIGAKVFIRRSNEVIPEITGSLEEYAPGEREVLPPDKCPSCGSALTETGAHLFCTNPQCRQQIVMRISHYASRGAMDIDTLSEKTAAALYDSALVRDIPDLYALNAEKLKALDGFGEKKAANLIKALEKSKRPALDAFIYAVGIPNVGSKTARDLAEAYGSWDDLARADRDSLKEIPDIGDAVADSVTGFFSDARTKSLVERLRASGVEPMTARKAEGGVFDGMTLVVTGTLARFTRDEAEKAIRDRGGKAAGSVSGRTSLVVAGENAGSKLDKARSLGVRVIGEEEFARMLDGID